MARIKEITVPFELCGSEELWHISNGLVSPYVPYPLRRHTPWPTYRKFLQPVGEDQSLHLFSILYCSDMIKKEESSFYEWISGIFHRVMVFSLSLYWYLSLHDHVSLCWVQFLSKCPFYLIFCYSYGLYWSHDEAIVFSLPLSLVVACDVKKVISMTICFKIRSHTMESLSTQCYYELCECFMLYLRVVCAFYVEFMNFIFFTPSKIIYITW